VSYFKTSYSTLQALARSRRYEDVAGFLVLARHASGLPHAGFEPYRLSGAGVNSIHEKAGISEEAARGVIQRLQEASVIGVPSSETKKAFFHARWEILQGALDLELPHALVDSSKDGGVDSALRRLKKTRIAIPRYAEKLTKISDTELRLDALMILFALYRHTSMHSFGGVAPTCIYRKWVVESQTPKSGGIRWGAEPKNDTAYFQFMAEGLAHAMPVASAKKASEPNEEIQNRFWNAWEVIKDVGLVYEAVSLYDVEPANKQARLQLTLRVNDYHAGSMLKKGDPSLLRVLEAKHGTDFAYYTSVGNERGEPEAMWVVLPEKRGALVGIWRPRFRPANQDAGLWFQEDTERVEKVLQRIEGNTRALASQP